jgi:hypothetical protein
MDDLSLRGHLEECEREIERLREENRHLRTASRFFGDLAERLHARLGEARDIDRPRKPTADEQG